MAVNLGLLNVVKKVAWNVSDVLVASIGIRSTYTTTTSSGGGSQSPYTFAGELQTAIYGTLVLSAGGFQLKPGGKPQPIVFPPTSAMLANYNYFSTEPVDDSTTTSIVFDELVIDQAYFTAVRDNLKTDRSALITAIPPTPIADTARQYFIDNAASIWPGETVDPNTLGAIMSDTNPVTGGSPITASHTESVTETTHSRELSCSMYFPVSAMRQHAAPSSDAQIIHMGFAIPEQTGGGTGAVECSLAFLGSGEGVYMASTGDDGAAIKGKSWTIAVDLTNLLMDATQLSGPAD